MKPWSTSELTYLEESWGRVSIPTIAKKLNRSTDAVRQKAYKCRLGRFTESGDYITLNQLFLALGLNSYTYIYSWASRKGLEIHQQLRDKSRIRVVYINEFWDWAEKNQSSLDFSKFEENTLGLEPSWVKAKRKRDHERNRKIIFSPWTAAEDDKLKYLLDQYKYSYPEISSLLRRTEGAIQRRILDLGLKARPIKANNHILWNDEEFVVLADAIKQGCSYEEISSRIGKSSKAIRGKVYCVYLTENLDKVRQHIGNGTWGNGRPERQICQRLLMSVPEKEQTREQLSKLAYLLQERIKMSIGSEYEEYWQKDMCQNWNDIEGCSAGQRNCDSCTEFIRIHEQYCKRCGKTFFERNQNDFCLDCRKARKSQYLRKAQRLRRNYYKNQNDPARPARDPQMV